jgi:nitroreductase
MARGHVGTTQTDRDGFEAVVRDPCRARHFTDDSVLREEVVHMVDLATCAVSVCDTQAWRFIAVQDPALLVRMREAVLDRFDDLALKPRLALQERRRFMARAQALTFAKAPLCIAVIALPSSTPAEEIMQLAGMTREEQDRLCVRPELQSAGAAVQLLTTSAHSLGYAACWSCAPIIAGESLEALLGVEAPARLVALVAIGRPSEQPVPPRKVPMEAALSFL